VIKEIEENNRVGKTRDWANEGEIGDVGFSLLGKGQGFPGEWGGTLLLPVFGP